MIEKKFEDALDRMGVPTRKEVQNLMTKVDKLSDRVDNLSKKMDKEATKKPATKVK